MARDHAPPRRPVELGPAEALRLLAGVTFGRLVFTRQALPSVRPVGHMLDDGDIVIRTPEGAALTPHGEGSDGRGVVVAYQADCIDAVTHLGWSVVVVGYARLVTDPGEIARVRARLEAWEPWHEAEQVARIQPELITGFRLG
ncbi:pyridoxamine 5'-phosphate oxidase family protein [Streptomyces griseoluteus]|uniref:pyridoxamine 5'-phosphate oxidase family protein n=1 Tax=Streptomyces griseoluteus TaxID=29306 RepID=UPI00370074D9